MPWYGDQYVCKAGRPTIGVTKKVSITLPAEVWEYIEDYKTKSSYFRDIAQEDYRYAEMTRRSVNK